jgi:hypothetical protein
MFLASVYSEACTVGRSVGRYSSIRKLHGKEKGVSVDNGPPSYVRRRSPISMRGDAHTPHNMPSRVSSLARLRPKLPWGDIRLGS